MEDISVQGRLQPKNPNILQLYSAYTPNGMKVAACLEELVAIKATSGAPFEYEPHSIDIKNHEQRRFLPTGKIPAIMDPKGITDKDVHLVESGTILFKSIRSNCCLFVLDNSYFICSCLGAILLYLAEKYNELIPQRSTDPMAYMDVIQWLFWGSSSFTPQCKAFGFYYKYSPHKQPYCVERYATEVKRLLGVLDMQLQQKHYVIWSKSA